MWRRSNGNSLRRLCLHKFIPSQREIEVHQTQRCDGGGEVRATVRDGAAAVHRHDADVRGAARRGGWKTAGRREGEQRPETEAVGCLVRWRVVARKARVSNFTCAVLPFKLHTQIFKKHSVSQASTPPFSLFFIYFRCVVVGQPKGN